MISDSAYESCLPILQDPDIEEEDKTERLEEFLQKDHSLSGKALEDSVLSALWRFRDSKSGSVASPPVRHAVVRKNSPAPWQVQRPSPQASPALGRASPAPPPAFGNGIPGFVRSKSYGGSAFSSPRPSPRLAYAAPIPHSPSLSDYVPSEPSTTDKTEYGDYSSDAVDWLVNEEPASRPTSSGGSVTGNNGLNAAAADWVQPQSNEMSPHDMLRSVMGNKKSDEEIENALEANGYDLSTTLMNLMGTQGDYQQDQGYVPEQEGQILIGKSMAASQPISIDQTERGRPNIVCKYWLSNGSCMRADCRFSHDLSSHICKYWVMGNCLAGDSCIFSHDPALLMNRMNLSDGIVSTPSSQVHPSFKVQDYDSFPALQSSDVNQWTQASPSGPQNQFEYASSPNSGRFVPNPRRQFEPRASAMNGGLSSSYSSNNSRPGSRHRSRERTPGPSIPAVDDNEAFPSLGAAGVKGGKKHHGKRGGHGHGHKENVSNSLADVVRMSPGPAPGLLRKGLMRSKSYTGSSGNSPAAKAIPAPEQVPWLETGARANHEYLKARSDAFKHGGLRNKFLQSAAQAWNRNDARAAKALSLRGQSENDLMRKAHREAAHLLYEQRNKGGAGSQDVYVDLHGLHPEEAVEYLEKALIENQNSTHPVYAITGTGHHSKGGKDKVGKAIRAFLSEWKYAFREFGMAGDPIGGILGIDPKSFDEALLKEKKEDGEVQEGESVGAKVKVVSEIPTGPRAKPG